MAEWSNKTQQHINIHKSFFIKETTNIFYRTELINFLCFTWIACDLKVRQQVNMVFR